MGGYGIVGGNLPLGAGMAMASDYRGTDDVTLCVFGDGAVNQGTFGETHEPGRAVEAADRVHGHQQPVRDGHLAGAPLGGHRPDAPGRGLRRARRALRRDGRGRTPTRRVCEALRTAREERRPSLVEAVTYRFRGHSMADPEEYRTKEQVAEWRRARPDRGVRRPAGRAEARWTPSEAWRRWTAARWRRSTRRSSSPTSPPSPPPSRCTTTSTCWATSWRAGTRSTSARRACTAESTSARWPPPTRRRGALRAEVSRAKGEDDDEERPADEAQEDED